MLKFIYLFIKMLAGAYIYVSMTTADIHDTAVLLIDIVPSLLEMCFSLSTFMRTISSLEVRAVSFSRCCLLSSNHLTPIF